MPSLILSLALLAFLCDIGLTYGFSVSRDSRVSQIRSTVTVNTPESFRLHVFGTKSELKTCNDEISAAKSLLLSAAEDKKVPSADVISSLLSLEKLMRKRNTLDKGTTSQETLKDLNGAWRLIFTTGTVDTQKKIGKVNYFPLKAVQSFSTSDMAITNGIYIGTFALLKFFGDFEWKEKPRKLEFDFDAIEILGLKINLPKGGAAKIGSSTGLGSESNVENTKRGKKPFFNWISADKNIATARGGGGGLALWRRDTEMAQLLLPK